MLSFDLARKSHLAGMETCVAMHHFSALFETLPESSARPPKTPLNHLLPRAL
jgi:hypothetical protein